MFGSLMMFASGLSVSAPSSARWSPIRWSAVRYSGKLGEDAAGERDVARLDVDARMLGERLHDRQERVGGESGRFVGLGVDDGRELGHVCGLKFQPAI